MNDDTRSVLRRALDDLNEGVRTLLGLVQASPAFVDELLERRTEDRRAPGAGRGCSLARPRGVGLRVPGTRRPRRSRVNHLSLLK